MTVTQKAYYSDYGDNRMEKYEVNGGIEESCQASSVCCFIHKNKLKIVKDLWGEHIGIKKAVATLAQKKEKYFEDKKGKFGKNQKYGNQPCAGLGTGFLITHNKVMTAKHVITAMRLQKISKFRAVFGYEMIDKDKVDTIPQESICRIKRIVASSTLGGEDWAICELAERPIYSFPVRLNLDYKIEEDDMVSMWGHPSGLPIKYVPRGIVMPNKDAKEHILTGSEKVHTYQLKIAAFHGNSGSPIFKDNKVVGILIAGRSDYELCDRFIKRWCRPPLMIKEIRTHLVSNEEIENYGYEVAQRIDSIKEFIEPLL